MHSIFPPATGAPPFLRLQKKFASSCIKCLLTTTLVILSLLCPIFHQNIAHAATTTADIDIPNSTLRVLLRPMTVEEVTEEGEAWFQLLQDKVSEVSAIEMQIITVNSLKVKDDAAKQEEAVLKKKLLNLRLEEGHLFRQTMVLIDAIKAKGGNIGEAEKYMASISDLDNASDPSSRTAAIIASVKDWLTSEDGGQLFIAKTLKAVVILIVFWILSKYAGLIIGKAIGRRKDLSSLLINFAKRSAGGMTMLVGLVIAVATTGVEVGPIMAAMGAGGFIIGFALQETLGNFASGLMIMIYHPFDVDDYVSLGGEEGKVEEMSIVSTTLLTIDNKVLILPNKTVWGGTIVNYTGRDTRRVDMVFGISYNDNIPHAMTVLREIATAHEMVLEEPEISINVISLGDSSVNLSCRPWVKSEDYWTVFWDLTKLIKIRFDEEGITIPYPQRDVHIHGQPATVTE